ncbi:alpha/beta fold hydrolase [Rubrivirga sp. S365]|uniref:Alpha/beta fold hydrolase n=1 Tax=Rubrivirga litoralis TaxID=3075598 RepID=A0ABU3BP89_9BACT|nr:MULTISPECIES: alpha/beta fold hydrolase [unclassified Rubrivirga]MDT0631108.1 alpha/beta fold hydrolase [Rubrivirga sp. F394]MDT7855379.1 alpha/beta fold hydrolase [Rubrivirga sp. S365]
MRSGRGGLLAVLAALLGGCAYVGDIATAPLSARVGPPPPGFEAVVVPIPVGGPLAAWIAAAPPEAPAVVLLHGLGDNRVDLLPRARLLADAGYAVLLVDLPAHGESPGERIGYGWPERHAAAAAVGFLRRSRPHGRVGVVAISLGGAAAALAGPALNADALVLESVYPTFEAAVGNRARRLLGPLAPSVAAALLAQTRDRIGVPADSLRPVDAVGRVRAPTFVMGGADDAFTPEAETRALFDAATGPKALWIVPGAKHEDLYEAAPDAYRRRVLDFLGEHLGRPAQIGPAQERSAQDHPAP